MRTSCNGCRVLRKGCTDDCIIRPCIEWIKTAESQGNATLFLTKFYGRAGLINLINAGPDNLRPAIFKSLLYEACGRIVDQVNGAIGLACTGNWHLCQAAVESVLNGTPITLMHQRNGASSSHLINPLNASSYDIRHVARELNLSASIDFHNVRTRARSRRTRSTHASGSSSVQEESLFSGQTVEPETLPETLNRVFNYGNSIGDPELGLELSLGLPYVVNAEGPVENCSAQMDDQMNVGS